MVLVETIPDTLGLGKEIQMVIQLNFSISLAHIDKIRDGKGGLLHVIAVTRSFVRRTVIFAAYTLLVEMVQQKSILEKVKRLNRKRKASDEREADKERCKKIGLERSASKTLLTLHLHTGKSGTLLDLSLESVVSAKEAEIEGLQEMEEQIIEHFPEPLPDDEPIDSNVDRDTQTDKKNVERMRHANFRH
ncbi:uncharacterized protein [Montipora foliosa]|uniref:uncharacterized protein n=1 Tax=Montipora foliosa TaxID=591990 RepID=UPI0035F18089